MPLTLFIPRKLLPEVAPVAFDCVVVNRALEINPPAEDTSIVFTVGVCISNIAALDLALELSVVRAHVTPVGEHRCGVGRPRDLSCVEEARRVKTQGTHSIWLGPHSSVNVPLHS